MKRSYALVVAVLMVIAVLAAALPVGAADNGPAMVADNSPQALAFRNDMRKLWEDHGIYTHQAIVCIANALPDVDPVLARLMRNQEDLGNAIKPYYGAPAGDKLTGLLKDHIAIAGEIVTAAKAGDNDKVADGQQRWAANGNDIAVFLNGANPDNWPLATLQDMMTKHLELVTNQAVSRLKGDYAGEIAAFDAGHQHILMMADALSLGIIHQFPAKFAGPVLTAAGGDDELVSCPVLGTTMPKSKMIPYEYKGTTYYLCCPPCVTEFKANPEKYIKHPAKPKPAGEGMGH